MKTKTWILLAALHMACGLDSVTVVDGTVEELDAAEAPAQELSADPLNLKAIDADVATGTLTGRYARVFVDAASARALLGGAMPAVDFGRNWLVAYRPEGKSAGSRVEVTRAQLSSTGKTLTLWATITEPAAGCAPWFPNEVSVVRVPKRPAAPGSIRVLVTRATAQCGVVVGAACTPGVTTCPAQTPLCHGGFERPDGVITGAVCAKLPQYEGISNPCRVDADCGAGGICAGNFLSQGEGLCQASWMRGTWSMPESGQFSAPLVQGGGWSRAVVRVTGQATVPMDATVQVFTDGIAPSRVEWRLINPAGTVTLTLRGLSPGVRHNHPVPGDEQINGDWVVEVRDVGTGKPGVLRGVRLSFTSRWD